MSRMTRRSLLATGTAATIGAAASVIPAGHGARAAQATDPEHTWGHDTAFGEQYYQRITKMLTDIRMNEMELIGDITSRMAATIKKGGTVWLQHNAGHMPPSEFNEKNKGNPGLLRSSTTYGGSDYDAMKAADVLVTNFVSENVRAARDRGVYVVGVPVNYVDNEWAPRGFVAPNPHDWLLADVTSVILQSYIPYTQGLVDCPEIPEMKLCPSSANALCSLFWMFQTGTASKLSGTGSQPAVTAATYLDTVLERYADAYARQKDAIFAAAKTVAKKIGNGAHYHVTSDHPGVQSESNGVAMGPMMTNAFRDDMKKGDVHLLATIEPDSAMILAEAKKARAMGMYVVIIAPGNAKALRTLADLFIDNLCPEGGGMFAIPGIAAKVATAGGVLNNMLMWVFTAQFVDEMVRRGWVPWFWLGFYQVGGREYDEAVKPFFLRQGF